MVAAGVTGGVGGVACGVGGTAGELGGAGYGVGGAAGAGATGAGTAGTGGVCAAAITGLDTRTMARARMIGRRGVDGLAYWMVATPVMFGWTVQMKVYEPAGIAGTS